VAKVKECIVKEEEWIDEDLSWRENPNKVSAGSYRKKYKIARE